MGKNKKKRQPLLLRPPIHPFLKPTLNPSVCCLQKQASASFPVMTVERSQKKNPPKK